MNKKSYEEIRKSNVLKNKERINLLNLYSIANEAKPIKKTIKRKKIDKTSEDMKPKRKSLRTQGLDPKGQKITNKNINDLFGVNDDFNYYPRITGTISFEDCPFLCKIRELDLNAKKYIPTSKSTKTLLFNTNQMSIVNEAVKVVQKRIVSMSFLPSFNSIILAVSDKNGMIGCINFSKNNQEIPILASQYNDYLWNFEPHNRTVSHLDWINSYRLLTSCYDASVRSIDLEKLISSEIYVDSDELCSFHSFSFFSPDSFLLSDNKGNIRLIDIRSSNNHIWKKKLHERKIGCVDVSENYFVTSSNDRTSCLFDLRKVESKPKNIFSFEHLLSVTSTYFSPNQKYLLSTSLDNHLRIFSVNDGRCLQRFNHNNHTGRYITTFKAVWVPNALTSADISPFVIGNMNRFLDVYTLNSTHTCQNLAPDYLTAIPAVNTFHPFLPFMASGNGSGKVHLWQ